MITNDTFESGSVRAWMQSIGRYAHVAFVRPGSEIRSWSMTMRIDSAVPFGLDDRRVPLPLRKDPDDVGVRERLDDRGLSLQLRGDDLLLGRQLLLDRDVDGVGPDEKSLIGTGPRHHIHR